MLTADNWCVKVNDKVYGPYSSAQLRKFAHEGRLAGWSMIAPAGSNGWRQARDDNTFASFFGETNKRATVRERTFGRRDGTEGTANDASTDRSGGPARRRITGRPGLDGSQHRAAEVSKDANFILVFDTESIAAVRLQNAIQNLGPALRIADNVWSVRCGLTAIGVRNALAPYLRPTETIFVVDATNGRTSWQNYPPESHSKISAAYMLQRK
ncbi:MAG: DUF4339 domain-containing protein [Pseudomonadota bacterium]